MTPIPILQAPTCISSLRQYTKNLIRPTQIVRGKKTECKNPLLKALFKTMPHGFPDGLVRRVKKSRMRNTLFKTGQAEYLTKAKSRELEEKKPLIATLKAKRREYGALTRAKSGTQTPKTTKREGKGYGHTSIYFTGQPPAAELRLLTVEESIDLVEKLVPLSLEFARPVIEPRPAAPQRISPSIPLTSVVSQAATLSQEQAKANEPEVTTIYGSVSTADIAAAIKDRLAKDKKGARVVLSPENVSIVGETVDKEKDRIKHLGAYEVEIKFVGAPNTIRRTVNVIPQS